MVGLDEIEFHFGRNVRRIVEGETKFCKLPSHLSSANGSSSDSDDQRLLLPGLTRGRRPAVATASASTGAAAAAAAPALPPDLSLSATESSDWASDYPPPPASSISSSGSSLDEGPPPPAAAAALNGSSNRASAVAGELEGLSEDFSEAMSEEGGAEELLRPLPSTFTTSENGRPLLDLVLSTPGNDPRKPSRAQDIQFLFLAMTEEVGDAVGWVGASAVEGQMRRGALWDWMMVDGLFIVIGCISSMSAAGCCGGCLFRACGCCSCYLKWRWIVCGLCCSTGR